MDFAVSELLRRRRVGFFGGSFDPPHAGHLAVARAVRQALELDEVWFVPVGRQPLKEADGTSRLQAGYEDRVAMTELAVDGEPGFMVSRIDAPRPDGRPNYTIAALREIAEKETCQLYLVMGADAFRLLPHWHEATEIPFTATLVVVSRPGEDLGRFEDSLPAGVTVEEIVDSIRLRTCRIRDNRGRSGELYFLTDLQVPVSATALRLVLQAGDGLERALAVAGSVRDYIAAHGLYSGRQSVG
jgi:nicotinate-nucleotide adenylyltransferase